MELDQENMVDVQQTASRMVHSANEIDQRIVQLYAMNDRLIKETVNKPDIAELPELALTQQLENTQNSQRDKLIMAQTPRSLNQDQKSEP